MDIEKGPAAVRALRKGGTQEEELELRPRTDYQSAARADREIWVVPYASFSRITVPGILTAPGR